MPKMYHESVANESLVSMEMSLKLYLKKNIGDYKSQLIVTLTKRLQCSVG